MTTPDDPARASAEATVRLYLSRADERLAHLVRDARRALQRALQTGLAEHSVAPGHWTFLRILWVRDGMNQRELSELAGVMEPTTFAALQAMEKLGYVVRQRRPENRKNIHVYLTDEGRALRDRLSPVAIGINERAVRGVSEADLAATRRTMLAMIQNLSEDEGLASSSETPSAPDAGARGSLPVKSA